MNDKIDILIPVYNGARYIKRCMEALMKQTYQNINIIVLNDGSVDNSLDIIESLAAKDDRIKVYSKKNEGCVSIARNYLLDKIESKYFIFVDADDVVSENYIQLLARAIEETGCRIACCEFTFFKGKLDRKADIRSLKIYKSNEAIGEFILGRRGHFMLWNKLIETDLIKNITFNNEINYGEDMFFILDVIQRNDISIASIKNRLYYYKYLNFKSISKGGINDNKKLFLETLVKYEKEDRYKDNSHIISVWIYLTATYYYFLCGFKKNEKEYRKYLRKLQKERFDDVKDEIEKIAVEKKL